MRFVALTLVCLMAAPVLAREKAATPKPACKLNYADELKAARKISTAAGFGIYPLEGGDVAKFLGVFNAAEPKTDFKADRILIAVNPSFAYVELFSGGCISHEGKLEPNTFEALMDEAFGDALPGGMAI